MIIVNIISGFPTFHSNRPRIMECTTFKLSACHRHTPQYTKLGATQTHKDSAIFEATSTVMLCLSTTISLSLRNPSLLIPQWIHIVALVASYGVHCGPKNYGSDRSFLASSLLHWSVTLVSSKSIRQQNKKT